MYAEARFSERSEPNIFESYKVNRGSMTDRYQSSKLLCVLLARELAEHEKASSPVVINTVNPGLCGSTALFDPLPLAFRFFLNIALFFLGRTSEMGSRVIMAAVDAGPLSHGQYLESGKVCNPSRFVLSDEGARVQKKAYAELADILEKTEPGITKTMTYAN